MANNKSTDANFIVPTESAWPQLPAGRLRCYTHLWQLELWLREIVYVELKSRYGSNWKQQIVGKSSHALKADNRLDHMPTRERAPLSYISFDSLIKTINKRRWLFAPYLPVHSIWKARLEEVSQIRNRVAHFRQGNDNDVERVSQLLEDIDKGVWRFCTSYNNGHPIYPPARDKVARKFTHLDPFPWTMIGDNTLVRIGQAPSDMNLSVSIDLLRRPWLKSKPIAQHAGKYGYLYDVHVFARRGRAFDYSNFLENTEDQHEPVCHLMLDSNGGTIRFTLPAVLGLSIAVNTIECFIDCAGRALGPTQPILQEGNIESLIGEWPEYVLGPEHPLSFLGPDMQCRMFDR